MFEQLPSVLVRNPGDVAGEALFVVDGTSGSLVYVNAAAASTFDLHGEGLGAVRVAALIPELADLAERRFVAHVAAPGGARECDVAVAALSGDAAGARLVSVRARPPAPPGSSPGATLGATRVALDAGRPAGFRRRRAGTGDPARVHSRDRSRARDGRSRRTRGARRRIRRH